MKIKLLRASNTVKEIEFAASLPPLEIQRLARISRGTKHIFGRGKRTSAVPQGRCPTLKANAMRWGRQPPPHNRPDSLM
jgi:hypothetical protein